MSDGRIHFKLIEYACLDGWRNMALDRRLLALGEERRGSAFLRFFTWAGPTLSMGHLEPGDAVDSTAAERDGVAIVKRPTGGRAVLHGDDLTYTVVLPRPDGSGLWETYNLISEILVDGLSSLGGRFHIEKGKTGRSRMVQRPCFASVSRYEVVHRGRKVVGSAQRVRERAILQHGSIPIGKGYLDVVDYMNLPSADRERLREEMEASTCCLSEVLGRHVDPGEVADRLAGAFRGRFRCDFNLITVDELGVDECGRDAIPSDTFAGASSSDKSP
jgi:lipoate-protein ligase A